MLCDRLVCGIAEEHTTHNMYNWYTSSRAASRENPTITPGCPQTNYISSKPIISECKQSHKEQHDVLAKQREFQVGDPVFVRDFPGGKRWISGSISSIEGPWSCHVILSDGQSVRRHIDHIRFHSSAVTPDDSSGSDDLVNYPSTEPVPATAPSIPLFVNPSSVP